MYVVAKIIEHPYSGILFFNCIWNETGLTFKFAVVPLWSPYSKEDRQQILLYRNPPTFQSFLLLWPTFGFHPNSEADCVEPMTHFAEVCPFALHHTFALSHRLWPGLCLYLLISTLYTIMVLAILVQDKHMVCTQVRIYFKECIKCRPSQIASCNLIPATKCARIFVPVDCSMSANS